MKPCERIVLDANYFRSLKQHHLAPVRERGFRVSVGLSAYYEAWAAAAREDKAGLLVGPARSLRDIIDPEYPLAPNSGDLLKRFLIVRRPHETDPLHPKYRAWSSNTWRLLIEGKADEAALLREGRKVNAHLDNRGETWTGYAHRWEDGPVGDGAAAKFMTADEQRALFKAMTPRKRHAQFVAHLTRDIGPHGLRVGLVRRRLHAFYNVVAWHMWNTASGARTATPNDSEDVTSLMHLAEPAFLLTRDHKLIDAVDASGTYQAPWVRTLEQFLEGPLPLGRPWGLSARLQAARFIRAK